MRRAAVLSLLTLQDVSASGYAPQLDHPKMADVSKAAQLCLEELGTAVGEQWLRYVAAKGRPLGDVRTRH